MGSTLRERKKQQTRQEISDVATRLFIERGFDTVTIAQIAAAADVAKMTVTNHFPRKEDLVLDLHEAMVRRPAETVANRATGQSALGALREAYFDALERRDALLGFSGPSFAGLVLGSPTLVARLREIDEQREHALAEALTDEGTPAGRPGGDPPPLLVAAQLNATHRVLFQEVLRRTAEGEPNDQIAGGVEPLARQAFDLLEPVLARHAVRQ
ncbi:TetR/AcrR family transcriptional regulator [Actinopolymorpha pittospori]